jgi:hypothetical protein
VQRFPLHVGDVFQFDEVTLGDGTDGGVWQVKAVLAFVRAVFDNPAILNRNLLANEIYCGGVIIVCFCRFKHSFIIHAIFSFLKDGIGALPPVKCIKIKMDQYNLIFTRIMLSGINRRLSFHAKFRYEFFTKARNLLTIK